MADKKKSVKKPSTDTGKAEKPAAPKTTKTETKPTAGFTPRTEITTPAPAVFDAPAVITVTGTKNGYNRKFTTNVSLLKSGEFGLFLNSVRQTRPNDYSVVTPDGMTFMFSMAPSLTDRIEVRKLR